MVDLHKIIKTCKQCGGSGEETIGNDINTGEPLGAILCRKCGGDTFVSGSSLHPDLIDMLKDMNNKINDIFEKVDV
jgi:hypothetical protein